MENAGGRITTYAPLSEACLTTLGRDLIFWRLENNRRVLEVFDPWTQHPVWTARKFDIAAQQCLLGNEAIGILEPSGQFTLLSLLDGRTLAEAKLKAETNLIDVTVIECDDRYLVLANSHQGGNVSMNIPTQPLPGSMPKPILNGRLYAIDKSGKLVLACAGRDP